MGWIWLFVAIIVIIIVANFPALFFYPLYAIFFFSITIVALVFTVVVLLLLIATIAGILDFLTHGTRNWHRGGGSCGFSNPCDPYPHDNAQSPKTEADYAQEQEQGSWHD